MYILTSEVQAKVPVTILHVKGEVDASNYQHLVAQATEAYQSGARNMLIDLSEVPFMASSGLVALHNIAVLMRGQSPTDPSAGWGAIRAIDRDLQSGPQQNVKLLNAHSEPFYLEPLSVPGTSWARSMTIGLSGTSPCGGFWPVDTFAMRFTTSIPFTTLPKTA